MLLKDAMTMTIHLVVVAAVLEDEGDVLDVLLGRRVAQSRQLLADRLEVHRVFNHTVVVGNLHTQMYKQHETVKETTIILME